MQQYPFFIAVVFILTTLATLVLFLLTVRNARHPRARAVSAYMLAGLVAWLAVQSIGAELGFFLDTQALPPRLVFAVGPPLLAILLLFLTKGGRRFLDSLSLTRLTYLNAVRVPVELVLYWLFLSKGVPELMTFEGRNFDILVGLTAPLIAYFGLTRHLIGRRGVLAWNIISLGILCNVIFYGVLSAPTPLQQFAFDQPNVALLYAPYIWLPALIVPVALFTHLVSIRQLLRPAGQEAPAPHFGAAV